MCHGTVNVLYLGDITDILRFANLEECAIGAVHSLDAFNFLLGLLFLIVFVTVLLVIYFRIKYDFNENPTLRKPANVLHYLMLILLIISILMGFCDILDPTRNKYCYSYSNLIGKLKYLSFIEIM